MWLVLIYTTPTLEADGNVPSEGETPVHGEQACPWLLVHTPTAPAPSWEPFIHQNKPQAGVPPGDPQMQQGLAWRAWSHPTPEGQPMS